MANSELYNSVIWELRKEIFGRGLTMQWCDDRSGNQDGYTAKLLHPETKQGRQGGWETLEVLVNAIFPDGFKVKISGVKPIMLSGPSTIEKAAGRNNVGRMAIRDFARFAGQRGARARNENMSPKLRSKLAKRAAQARWRKNREAAKCG